MSEPRNCQCLLLQCARVFSLDSAVKNICLNCEDDDACLWYNTFFWKNLSSFENHGVFSSGHDHWQSNLDLVDKSCFKSIVNFNVLYSTRIALYCPTKSELHCKPFPKLGILLCFLASATVPYYRKFKVVPMTRKLNYSFLGSLICT